MNEVKSPQYHVFSWTLKPFIELSKFRTSVNALPPVDASRLSLFLQAFGRHFCNRHVCVLWNPCISLWFRFVKWSFCHSPQKQQHMRALSNTMQKKRLTSLDGQSPDTQPLRATCSRLSIAMCKLNNELGGGVLFSGTYFVFLNRACARLSSARLWQRIDNRRISSDVSHMIQWYPNAGRLTRFLPGCLSSPVPHRARTVFVKVSGVPSTKYLCRHVPPCTRHPRVSSACVRVQLGHYSRCIFFFLSRLALN